MKNTDDYSIFLKFIDKYLPVGFKDIKQDDPLVREMNSMMKKNKQHFHIADMVELKIIYVSNTIEHDLGIKPEAFSPKTELDVTHPDDYDRFMVVRSKFIKLCSNLYNQNNEFGIMTTNSRLKHIEGFYTNFLIQGYAFSVSKPKPTVYALAIKTNIDWFGPIKHGFNNYIGKDMAYFRKPDKKLILTGCIFTDREYEIIRLIRDGLDSHAIGKKLFISSHTVDTHRRNILKKTNKNTTSELIIDLQEKGFF